MPENNSCFFKQELYYYSGIELAFIFCILEQKGPLLVVSVINTHSQQPRIRSFWTFYAHQTIINRLLRHYSPTVYYLLQCWFSIRKRTGFAGKM
jgi:hypothetical protein